MEKDAAITKGLTCGAVSCLLWSAVYPICRHISQDDPVVSAFLRFLIAGMALGGVVAIRRPPQFMQTLTNDAPRMAFLGLTGIFGMGTLIFASSEYTISVNTGVLINANPIFVVFLAAFIGERITPGRVAGVLIGIVGCVFVIKAQPVDSLRPPENNFLGCALAVGGSFCWALYMVAGKSMVRKYGGMVTTTLAILMGVVMLFVLMLVRGRSISMEAGDLGWFAFLGIGPTALGYFLWYHAMNTVDAARIAPLQFIAPIGTAFIGWSMLGEEITWFTVIGMLLVFLGIYVSSIRGARRRRRTECSL